MSEAASEEKRTVQYAPELLAKAEEWKTYPSSLMLGETEIPCVRCDACGGVIYHLPGSPVGRAYHMLIAHGYRMDGSHESDRAIAALRASAAGEMNTIVEV